jgi:hypothetical protein
MATLTLGEREYAVSEPSLRASMAWRRKLKEALGPVLPEIGRLAPGLLGRVDVSLGEQAAAEIGTALLPVVMDAPDLMVEMTLDYWPELAADAEYILDHARMGQIALAFVEALKSAYPFGALLAMEPARSNGGQPKQPEPTKQNLR